EAGRDLPVIGPDDAPPPAALPATGGEPNADTEAAVLYTSGTTGSPKGCVLTNTYFTHCGAWYRGMGGLCALEDGAERMLTPLPLFHMNALACSVMAMLATGGCLIVLDRFHPRSWWASVRDSRATCIHYLGVMPPMLMGAPESEADRDHAVRFGFGAGVPGDLHAPFEARFGFPLIEAWAMTETGAGGVITAHEEPRHVGTACFGRTDAGVEARVVGDDGSEAGADEPGELLVRRAGPDPRHGFFDRYLKDEVATEAAWKGGWLHTGDVVRRDAAGNFRFVDRKKNVIRRSGENIAAVEVEGALRAHPLIEEAGVAPVPDEVRGDEVFALLVPSQPLDDPAAAADEINAWMLTRLAYYKAPGFIAFVEALPVTATNKVQRAKLKDEASRLLAEGVAIDLRATKKRPIKTRAA
ncbi:MAG: AMP-binding protein, partial [Pseudomonadota bacterium]